MSARIGGGGGGGGEVGPIDGGEGEGGLPSSGNRNRQLPIIPPKQEILSSVFLH